MKWSTIILAIVIGFLLCSNVFLFTTKVRYLERPISRNQDSPYQDYTNSEVRDAIDWVLPYVSNRLLLKEEQYAVWLAWKDSPFQDLYFYWILSYAFNI